MEPWKKLTRYLSAIQNISEHVLVLLHITFKNPERGHTNMPLHLVRFCSHVGSTVSFTEQISIDDLLGNVNRHKYYRYKGSLTTPSCNEAVVWTVFKESVKVDKDLVRTTHRL